MRSAVRETGTKKLYDDGSERPFEGLNVIFAGDFLQLDPPEKGGNNISRIPGDLYEQDPKHPPNATNEYGLSLFWGFGRNSLNVAGVTELWRPERCKDLTRS